MNSKLKLLQRKHVITASALAGIGAFVWGIFVYFAPADLEREPSISLASDAGPYVGGDFSVGRDFISGLTGAQIDKLIDELRQGSSASDLTLVDKF